MGITVTLRGGSGDMLKSVYDPDLNGLIASAQFEAEVKLLNGKSILTVAQQQALTATGTALLPNNMNNSAGGSVATFDAIGEYVEIDFTTDRALSQFRIDPGEANHAADGSFKVQYWDGSAWADWITGISTETRAAGTFNSWVDRKGIITSKIRIVCTAVDTRGAATDYSFANMFEIKW